MIVHSQHLGKTCNEAKTYIQTIVQQRPAVSTTEITVIVAIGAAIALLMFQEGLAGTQHDCKGSWKGQKGGVWENVVAVCLL